MTPHPETAERHRSRSSPWRRRPALYALVPFATGIAAEWTLGWPFEFLAPGAAVLLVAMAFHRGRTVAYATLGLIGMARTAVVLVGISPLAPAGADTPAAETFVGRVCAVERGREGRLAIEGRFRPEGEDGTVRSALLQWRDPNNKLEPGDLVRVVGTAYQPEPARNPGGFDQRAWLRQKGIAQVIRAKGSDTVAVLARGAVPSPSALAERSREWVRDRLFALLPEAVGGLATGLALGERRAVRRDLLLGFERAGAVHVLAASGLHVGIVASLAFILAGLVGLGRRGQSAVVAIASGFFVLIVGAGPSAVRAWIMLAVALAARATERDADWPNVLAFAALCVLAIDPGALFSPGFQLSFSAVFGIAWLYRPLVRHLPTVSALASEWLGRGLTSLFAVTIAAQLATLPVVAYHFSQVPLFALVANPLAVPLVGLALPAVLCAVAFSIVSTLLGTIIANAALLPLYGLVALGQFFETLPLATAAVGGKEWPWCLALVALGMLALGAPGEAFRARSALCAVALAAVLTWHDLIAEKTPVEIAFMDVGQGDAALVRLPEGAVLLVDGGPRWGTTGAGKSVIAPAMAAMGLDRVDVVLLSHPDADHLGGLVYVLRHLGVRAIL